MRAVIGPSPETVESEPTSPEEGPRPPGAAPRAEALARFCVNFTERAREGKIDPIFGRHREIR